MQRVGHLILLLMCGLGTSQCRMRNPESDNRLLSANGSNLTLTEVMNEEEGDLAYQVFSADASKRPVPWPYKPLRKYRIGTNEYEKITFDAGVSTGFSEVGVSGGVKASETWSTTYTVNLILIKSMTMRRDGRPTKLFELDNSNNAYLLTAEVDADGKFIGDIDEKSGQPIPYVYYCEYKGRMAIDRSKGANIKAFILGMSGSTGHQLEYETSHWTEFRYIEIPLIGGPKPTAHQLYNDCVREFERPTTDYWGMKTTPKDQLSDDLKLLSSVTVGNATDTVCDPGEAAACQEWYKKLWAPHFYLRDKPMARCAPLGTGKTSGECQLRAPAGAGCALYAKNDNPDQLIDERKPGYQKATIGLEGYPCDIGTQCTLIDKKGLGNSIVKFLQKSGGMGLRAKCLKNP